MADVAWFIGEGGQKRGPYTREDVEAFVRAGRVRRDTLVWCEGMTNWTQAEAAGLFTATPRTASALPPATAGAMALPGASAGAALQRFFANYATFSGRASRAEFWWPTLALAIVSSVAVMTDLNAHATGGAPFASPLVFLATALPSLAVTVRRLHDSDKSGWLLLLVFIPFGQLVLLALCAMAGTPGPNRYGATA